jgi:hypothetical protein
MCGLMRDLAQDQEPPLAKANSAANWIANLCQQLALHLEACGTDEVGKFNLIADLDDMRREQWRSKECRDVFIPSMEHTSCALPCVLLKCCDGLDAAYESVRTSHAIRAGTATRSPSIRSCGCYCRCHGGTAF